MNTLHALADAVVQFPRFLLDMVVGLIYAILTEAQTFTLTVFAVLVGFAADPLTGAAVGMGFYVVLSWLAQAMSSLLQTLSLIGRSIQSRND